MSVPKVFERGIRVKFTSDQINRARHIAALRGITFSALIRQALDRELATADRRRRGH